ncbi:MAG: hypothetical protein JWL81_995 [Verrucomicrobiales bacterium]|nr:hypothetical protein [Verrucomicrobiales bacterium]
MIFFLRLFSPRPLLSLLLLSGASLTAPAAESPALSPDAYEKVIKPILTEHCFDCHADGAAKGNVTFDPAPDGSLSPLLANTELWLHVLKNVRGDLMPPAKKPRLTPDEQQTLVSWIKSAPLRLDPQNPDPGRVTLRRLNRVEYRNTIRDLMGLDFRTDEEFPADDTGYGFDNIGDVLTTSPLLLEKYMQAAEAITARAVPLNDFVIPTRRIGRDQFHGEGENRQNRNEIILPVYNDANLTASLNINKEGTYRLIMDASVVGSFPYDPGKATAVWSVEEKPLWQQEIKWQAEKKIDLSTEHRWTPGTYPIRLVVTPSQPASARPKEVPGEGQPWVDLRFRGAILEGPLEPENATRPENYCRFFPAGGIPADPAARHTLTTEILRRFTTLAFRRPVDEATIARLTQLAEETAHAPEGSFQKGIARALTAVLASPRFLFRMESTLPIEDPAAHPMLDEFALASRLSYFLWSTMPDAELTSLAEAGKLRENLPAQIKRLLADSRSNELVKNFAGQWLQTRDVESVSIDARLVQARDAGSEKDLKDRFEKRRALNQAIDEAEKNHDDAKLAELKAEMTALRSLFGTRRIEFSGDLRSAMRREAEMLFSYLLKNDKSVLDLISNNQTFLNGPLARHYDIPNIDGDEMRLVDLPPDSPRGGILTMGTVLAVTSNPTRTSPVKRGLFILDNILGTPPPPAPPNVPSLDASEKSADGRELPMREALELHRNQPLCASCHNRMDPLGFALENFNAMGLWRDKERGQALPSPAGTLVTGEPFADVRALKQLIVTSRRADYYRCLTEKLLTYALGRGPQACDIQTIDAIVDDLEKTNGRFSTLITGIIQSPPFQKRQRSTP